VPLQPARPLGLRPFFFPLFHFFLAFGIDHLENAFPFPFSLFSGQPEAQAKFLMSGFPSLLHPFYPQSYTSKKTGGMIGFLFFFRVPLPASR